MVAAPLTLERQRMRCEMVCTASTDKLLIDAQNDTHPHSSAERGVRHWRSSALTGRRASFDRDRCDPSLEGSRHRGQVVPPPPDTSRIHRLRVIRLIRGTRRMLQRVAAQNRTSGFDEPSKPIRDGAWTWGHLGSSVRTPLQDAAVHGAVAFGTMRLPTSRAQHRRTVGLRCAGKRRRAE
jgi:hypothetical protein